MEAGRPCLLPHRADRLPERSLLAALGPAQYRRVGGTHGPSDDGSRTALALGRPPSRKRQYLNTWMVRLPSGSCLLRSRGRTIASSVSVTTPSAVGRISTWATRGALTARTTSGPT